ncbi:MULTISPECIES: helix-turn-helix domain-containing protein [Actinobacillus]|uniref:helix-turn-helix domain-containing protein n=1 Tax=Actinobacillus TaxID=713 RepID=UPI00036D0C4E|nr:MULTISPECIES: helix-turn-helix transcriptional regulator [Actinobacillus]WGE51151.1 helix-turn-helix domain-containing protein [Actinobacillus equuli subsp. haemolyticus]WGE65600.1 helix-turn-helix domain-containing protein [Actinobacillus equuli subsp. equuli]WGE83698.1 helix-turn-helix domain-containing protein [Actinobacillus equuli subsp. equuli]
MNNSSLFAVRLKNERNRLGLTQADIANKCRVSREMWGKYERGVALAGSEVLFSLTEIGVDIGYLFSGTRSVPLTENEISLLDDYRQSNEQGKAAIEQTAQALSAVNKLLQSSENTTKKQSSSHTEMHIGEVKQQNNIQHLEGGITFKEGD